MNQIDEEHMPYEESLGRKPRRGTNLPLFLDAALIYNIFYKRLLKIVKENYYKFTRKTIVNDVPSLNWIQVIHEL
jgi:hypothetical protein